MCLIHLAQVSTMGLLSLGSPLSWSETKQYADHVRKHGILQFLHIYNKLKDRENDCLKWGDEVQCLFFCTSNLLINNAKTSLAINHRKHDGAQFSAYPCAAVS